MGLLRSRDLKVTSEYSSERTVDTMKNSGSNKFGRPLLFILLVVGIALATFFLLGVSFTSAYDEVQGYFITEKPAEGVALELKSKEWEGILWKSTSGNVLGIAVRRAETEIVGPRLGYIGGARTVWGWCDIWSTESKGLYCLIRESDLRGPGEDVFRRYTESYIYNALP